MLMSVVALSCEVIRGSIVSTPTSLSDLLCGIRAPEAAGQENIVFCIFSLQGPIRTQIDRRFFEDHYFPKYNDTKL